MKRWPWIVAGLAVLVVAVVAAVLGFQRFAGAAVGGLVAVAGIQSGRRAGQRAIKIAQEQEAAKVAAIDKEVERVIRVTDDEPVSAQDVADRVNRLDL